MKKEEQVETIRSPANSSRTNLEGIPTYAGLSGNRLIAAVTIIATTGFTLFGLFFLLRHFDSDR